VKRGYLGTEIKPVDADTARQFNLKVREGALVKSVLPGSPAEKAGLEPGDLILKLNDHPINDPTALQATVEQLSIGSSYPLVVSRGGKQQTLNVTVTEMPKNLSVASHDEEDRSPSNSKFDKLGLDVRPLTRDLAKQFGLTGNPTGLIISGVEDGSAAQAAGLKSGDLIEKAGGHPVSTVEDYEKAREQFSKGDGLVLNIRTSDGRKSFVVLKD
jgi:serine protease Do